MLFTAPGATVEPHSKRFVADENGCLRSTVLITNPQGLHMRPAMAFAKTASRYASTVSVWHGDRSANGKSLLNLMMLAAESGTELVVEVQGSDAAEALSALVDILAAPAAEELEVDPAPVGD